MRVLAAWEAAGSWTPEDTKSEPKPPETPDPLPARFTISEVTTAYLSKCKSPDIEPSTLAKYKTLTNQRNRRRQG